MVEFFKRVRSILSSFGEFLLKNYMQIIFACVMIGVWTACSALYSTYFATELLIVVYQFAINFIEHKPTYYAQQGATENKTVLLKNNVLMGILVMTLHLMSPLAALLRYIHFITTMVYAGILCIYSDHTPDRTDSTFNILKNMDYIDAAILCLSALNTIPFLKAIPILFYTFVLSRGMINLFLLTILPICMVFGSNIIKAGITLYASILGKPADTSTPDNQNHPSVSAYTLMANDIHILRQQHFEKPLNKIQETTSHLVTEANKSVKGFIYRNIMSW